MVVISRGRNVYIHVGNDIAFVHAIIMDMHGMHVAFELSVIVQFTPAIE